jgi:cytosine/adenosine deaminase-related metal-dependent hydrolase
MHPFDRTRPVTFVGAQVLGSEGVLASRVRIAHGRIAALDATPGAGDLVIELNGAIVAPGLINAHDHLELNNFPRLKWRERYDNAGEWIADFQPRFESDPELAPPRAAPLNDRLLIGGLKNLLSGVTAVCHHNPMHRELRRGFPIRVVRDYRYSHSLLIDGDKVVETYRSTPRDWPWIIHLAEGTDADAAREFARLDRLGCLGSNTVIVHGVGLALEDRCKLMERGRGLIWCPSSNLFTLNATIDVRELSRARKAALGSDSRLSGGRDLLEEMQVAFQTEQVDARSIVHMVSVDAAALLGLRETGRIAEGAPADLAIFPAKGADAFTSLIAAQRADVRLVMIGGRALYGDVDLAHAFRATRVKVGQVQVDGCAKLLARSVVQRVLRSTIGEVGLVA